MSEFNYNILTVNGITKICDNNMYIYNKKAIHYQWYYYQLAYILKQIKKENIDPLTGLSLTKEQMCKIIQAHLESRPGVTFNTPEDSKYGLVPLHLEENTISSDNLGGIPDIFPKSNILGLKLQTDPTTFLKGTDADEFLNNSTNDKNNSKKKGEWYTPTTERSNNVRQKLDSYGDNFLNYGRLVWGKNSCWADSILVMLFFKIFENDDGLDIIHPFVDQYILKDIESEENIAITKTERKYNCFHSGNFKKSYPILKEINETFKELYRKLMDKDIFTVAKLIKSINKCPSKRDAENLEDGGYHDALVFFKMILNIFNIPSEEYNEKNTLKLNTRDVTYIDNSDNMFKNKLVNDDGNHIVSDLNIEHDSKDTNIITKDISYLDLINFKKVSPNGGKVSLFLDFKHEEDLDDFYELTEGTTLVSENGRRYIVNGENKIDITDNIYKGNLATNIPKRVVQYIITDTDHIFFGVNRLSYINGGETFDSLPIIPDETLTLLGGKILLLRSIIVCYNTNHYVTFFQKKIYGIYTMIYLVMKIKIT